MKAAEALLSIAGNSGFVISGESGQEILNFYNQTLEQIKKKSVFK